ncbi:helix-turn-helix domain-containing protein [Streptomyces bullii]|uniref:Helix-turn-helix domain-containing protein n=1 Tax=Streptomyces bullii TaxID=349910 RepID=A0ABW0UWV6_9ACTN
MSEGTAAAEFAALLGELKERSGLSYGVLARRLHLSTSTLHRYCNGDAVPTEYAPVERLARLCKASPDELVELHRRWVLADAVRRRKGAGAARAAAEPAASGPAEPQPAGADGPAGGVVPPGATGTPVAEPVAPLPEAEAAGAVPSWVASGAEEPRRSGRTRRRTAVVAGLAVAVVSAVTLAVSLPSRGADHDGRRGSAEAAGSPDGGTGDVVPAPPSPSRQGAGKKPGQEAGTESGEPTGKQQGDRAGKAGPSAAVSASPSGGGRGGNAGVDSHAKSAPLTVRTSPYVWEGSCTQHYLINRPPTEVGPPPLEQDAPAWVAVTRAVSSGEQFLEITVQGTGEETVLIEDLKVRTVGKRAPLPWNDYAMGVGCGGDVRTRAFTVDLDAPRPDLVPKAGQDGFPAKVSESDPEVYHVKAKASAYDVSWYLELKWSSGGRHGTVELNDAGRPFRTSGNQGRPAYEFPVGGQKWDPAPAFGAP